MSKHKKSHNHSHQRCEQFTQAAPSRRAGSPTMVMLALSALFGVVLVYVIVTGVRASSQVRITEIASAGSDVTLPVATFTDGAARFYRYTTTAGREIRFFVMKSSDGVVRAAFDTCDTYYRERKGYRQQGDLAVAGLTVDAKELHTKDADTIHTIPNTRNLSAVAPKLVGTSELEGRRSLLIGVRFQQLGPEIDALVGDILHAERLAVIAWVSKRFEQHAEPEVKRIVGIAGRLARSNGAHGREDGEQLAPAAAHILRALHDYDAVFPDVSAGKTWTRERKVVNGAG